MGIVVWLDDRILKMSARRREEKHHQEIVELKRKIYFLEQKNSPTFKAYNAGE